MIPLLSERYAILPRTNILCLPVDLLSDEAIDRVVTVWLETPFDGGRHERRVNKISAFERNGR